jgi:hypothetical protein
MNLEKLSTGDLLNYSTILENIITTNIAIQREISEAISGKFCTAEEIAKINNKSFDAETEADKVYEEIQKELDLRVKKDLGLKFGIRRSQSIIKELDAFVRVKNSENEKIQNNLNLEAKKISEETIANMSISKDDNS